MKRVSYHISRIGLGITFLWIGVLIFRNPVAWGSYLQPWAAKFVPIPIAQDMMGTAVLDMAIGILLLLNMFIWLVALVGVIHILSVLIVSGITDITLKFFINGLKTTKGIERNLFAKKFLSNIFYSPESIKIRFISRQSGGEAAAKAKPSSAIGGAGRANTLIFKK